MAVNTTNRGIVREDYGCSVLEGNKYSGGTVIATGGSSPAFSESWVASSISPCEVSSEVLTIMINELNEFTNGEGYSLEEREEGSMLGEKDQVNIRELIKLPLGERRRILKQVAQDEDMKEEYKEGGDLRKFQALGEDDFDADP